MRICDRQFVEEIVLSGAQSHTLHSISFVTRYFHVSIQWTKMFVSNDFCKSSVRTPFWLYAKIIAITAWIGETSHVSTAKNVAIFLLIASIRGDISAALIAIARGTTQRRPQEPGSTSAAPSRSVTRSVKLQQNGVSAPNVVVRYTVYTWETGDHDPHQANAISDPNSSALMYDMRINPKYTNSHHVRDRIRLVCTVCCEINLYTLDRTTEINGRLKFGAVGRHSCLHFYFIWWTHWCSTGSLYKKVAVWATNS